MMYIRSYTTVHTGGNCMADLIELADERVICITDECVALYPSREAFDSGDFDDFANGREREILEFVECGGGFARVDNAEQRSPIGLTFVDFIEAYEPDGPVSVDLLHLPDGRVIGLDCESLVIYPNREAFDSATSGAYPTLDLTPCVDDDARSYGPNHRSKT